MNVVKDALQRPFTHDALPEEVELPEGFVLNTKTQLVAGSAFGSRIKFSTAVMDRTGLIIKLTALTLWHDAATETMAQLESMTKQHCCNIFLYYLT